MGLKRMSGVALGAFMALLTTDNSQLHAKPHGSDSVMPLPLNSVKYDHSLFLYSLNYRLLFKECANGKPNSATLEIFFGRGVYPIWSRGDLPKPVNILDTREKSETRTFPLRPETDLKKLKSQLPSLMPYLEDRINEGLKKASRRMKQSQSCTSSAAPS